ncbi:transglycosylase SLT domain-containing protein [Legionella sp. km772]|uniref:transglycosylase SLT domain-containing protein n=1 Tax=Legionella sp. km772 TaxID=2498111 RepID=UPI000F8CBE67|nr:transglycosylase SLT domain-containing protein [Legionella sp. km772]RUR09383.1 lytic murein transglycosylase [Legionella sp. km772]
MKKFIILMCGLFWSMASFSLSGQAYMDRFNTFTAWYQQLPLVPSPAFLEFVKESSPLANKLRDKWLYELARTKDWQRYVDYYQPTSDINLVCYNQIARYNLGHEEQVLKDSAPIWLIGESRPQACNTLFDLLLKNDKFDQNLITQRITLALDKRNISLARYLLKHYKIPHPKEADQLSAIHQRPMLITTLEPSEFNSNLYLYGLKRLVSLNMDQALKIWNLPKSKLIMNEAHQQAFLAHVALYKAMRNSEDTLSWFNKIKPQYYNDVLVDWQIRFALKLGHWQRVEQLINNSKNKDLPCWQYWLARALEAQGKKEEAQAIYAPLAKSRQYYGFLASLRLNQKPSFENEGVTTDLNTLKPYQPIIDQIKAFHAAKQDTQASRLLNDFISELPKEDASALVYWVDSSLQWHGKSVYLSNNEKLNNQLSLRFPLAYQNAVKMYAKQYNIPPEFVYAIIRQESGFREDVVSFAGARGLMQVMPRTASVVSKMSKIPYSNQDQLFLSQKNINIGIAYLQQLTKRFSNHPVLVAAAYNAGPRQVVYWLKNHPPKEIDLWIETLPWQETRNYLKNVMAFAVVYQYRLNQKPNLTPFLTHL